MVALHGRAEALKSPLEGAMGWPRDYALVRAIDRLRAPPLREADYEGLVEPDHLIEVNDALAKRPFGGVIVACPWLPDVHPAATGDISAYRSFITSTLLPRVHRETPSYSSSGATGIDGVSLGGVVALRIGLTCPDTFGAVSGIQPAIARGQEGAWVSLAQAARARQPEMNLRLVTSHDDDFREPIEILSRAWTDAGVAHDFANLPGPHDYIFNRGPGSIELLLWQDRVLSRA
ncbi:MAG: alpha/beta hydrolase-fold protein [Polyangiaceae bacterium]